jgi:phenylalanyl-tRNA synthetase beta chain
VTLRAPDRTLSGDEAAAVRERIVAFVHEAEGAELRA